MMKVKLWSLLILLFLFSGSCGSNDDGDDGSSGPLGPAPYTVDIFINSPEEGSTVDVNTIVPVNVSLRTSNEDYLIRDVLIILQDGNGVGFDTLVNEDVNQMNAYAYQEFDAFTPSQTGTYKLEVSTQNSARGFSKTETSTFTVQ